MKIGILTYHAACNNGAFLQLLSTVEYIKSRGFSPVVINWVPNDFEKDYLKRSSSKVRELYYDLTIKHFSLTRLCRTSKDIAEVIKEQGIKRVIIGSDAVIQHHTIRERIHFPCRRIVFFQRMTKDRLFPNAFWGDFNHFLDNPIPIAMISGASVDSKYQYISGITKKKMKKCVNSFRYFSVRDEWSQKMIEYITDGEVKPDITPDPVFAFNYNALKYIPSKESILNKFKLPDNYILLSFKKVRHTSVDQEWINDFQDIANRHNLSCVKLPYPDVETFGNIEISIGECITPLEWYALIKYSKGYVGNNMHPIVVFLHNSVPFFSFDNYGIKIINGNPTDGESSKIYQILKIAGLDYCRFFSESLLYSVPSPSHVFECLKNFDIEKATLFANSYYNKYQIMMNKVFEAIDI